MMKIKRIMAIVFCISILSSILCFDVSAVVIGEPTFKKSLDGKSYICTGIDDKSVTSVTIPKEHNGLPVSSIGGYAFKYCASLEKITIPSSVTSIGNKAFSGCTSLKAITIPSSVTSIGERAFEFCKALKAITIPSSVTSIGKYAFTNCKALKEIIISNSAISINEGVFCNCTELTNINMPKVTSIGEKVFAYCTKLTNISMPKVTSIGKRAFESCIKLTNINMPKVISIGDSAFNNCESLKEITIPSSVTSIGNMAFDNCTKLKEIKILNGVTSIGDGAFNFCKALKAITIPSTVTSIGNGAFAECIEITKIKILNGVTSIGDGAFYNCESLKEITIPSSVTSIGEMAFDFCTALKSVHYTGTREEWNNIVLDEGAKRFLNSKNIIFSCNVPTITEVTGNPTEWINNVTLTVSVIANPEGKLNAKPYSFSTIKGVYNWQAENTATFDHNQTVYIYIRDSAGNALLRNTQIINKIDNTAPTFTDVSRNQKDLSNGNVTLTVNVANDSQSGLCDKPYSFSTKMGVYNWQAENTATFAKSGTVYIYVQDKVGNIIYCGSQMIEAIPKISQPSKNETHATNRNVSKNVITKNSSSFKPLAKRLYNTMPNAINQNTSNDVTPESPDPDIQPTTSKPTTTKSATINSTNNKPNENKNNNWKIVVIVIIVVGGVVTIVCMVRRKKR